MTTVIPNDEYMEFDEFLGQWVLTPKAALVYCNINMDVELKDSEYPEIQAKNILARVSSVIYAYIHKFTVYNDDQDYVLANYREGKDLIQRVLIAQLQYMKDTGDLTHSTDDNERSKAIDEVAKSLLERPLRCYGFKPIIYVGL